MGLCERQGQDGRIARLKNRTLILKGFWDLLVFKLKVNDEE